jgi:ElaA protein
VLTFSLHSFEQISKANLYQAMCLRDLVFVVGQKITAIAEIDGEDPNYHHLLGRDDAGQLIAYARLGLDSDPVNVGRIAIHPDHRGAGLGDALMAEIHRILSTRDGQMHAQAYLVPWYSRLGWTVCGDPFLEAEIPHLPMRWQP